MYTLLCVNKRKCKQFLFLNEKQMQKCRAVYVTLFFYMHHEDDTKILEKSGPAVSQIFNFIRNLP